MPKKIINLFDLEELFEKNLPSPIAGYYKSGARDEITLKKNIEKKDRRDSERHLNNKKLQ